MTSRPESAPPGTAASRRERIAQRAGRIAPEAAQADFLLHADLAFGASPLPSCIRYARATGEARARQQLQALLASLQQAGLDPSAPPR